MAYSGDNGRPAALFVAPIMPSDRGNGLAMRAGFLLRSYAKRFDIDLAVVPVSGGAREPSPLVAAHTRRAVVLPIPPPDTQFRLINSVVDPIARLAAFRRYGRPSITARLGPDLHAALLAFTHGAAYALVHVSRLYLASLARPWMKGTGRPRLVLDCDEDEAAAYRRLAWLHRKHGDYGPAGFAAAEATAFGTFAKEWLPRFDLLLVSSRQEAELVQAHGNGARTIVVPNVVPSSTIPPVPQSRRASPRDIVFVGNMSYLPNIDAATWFALKIWPRVRAAARFPLRFVIAGAGPPPELAALARRSGIVVTGGFDDPAPLYRRAAIAVIPIRAGGGTRIKLLESAYYGVPIVATRFGAVGTGFRSGYELLLADSEGDFVACCARLLADRTLASRLTAAARRRVRRDYEADSCSERLLGRLGRVYRDGANHE